MPSKKTRAEGDAAHLAVEFMTPKAPTQKRPHPGLWGRLVAGHLWLDMVEQ